MVVIIRAGSQAQYHSLTRPCSTRQVTIIVEMEGRTFPVRVDPKSLVQNPVHKVAQGLGIDLPGWWHVSVVMGLQDNHTYQDGDGIRLFPATTESIEAMRGPRTPK
jgi:hypothetical protein